MGAKNKSDGEEGFLQVGLFSLVSPFPKVSLKITSPD